MSIVLSPGNYFGKEQQVGENAAFLLNITAYQPDVQIGVHYHQNAYLSLLINGSYEEVSRKTDRVVIPGEVLFRPAGYSHANHFRSSGGRCLNIEFKSNGLQELELDHLLPGAAAIYKTGTFDYLYRLLYAFLQDPKSALPEEHMISWLLEYAEEKLPERLPWLPKVKAILENEFDTHHTIRSLAARVFVHPIYLARAFKEREGITPGEYQLKMRVRKAMTLLFTTSLPVTDIAFSTGFSDASHLVKCFRLFYKATPHKFRALLKS
ncbi:helix-turn-helix transcriptional regulator [Chitinophaga sp.]|uniref:helix-turn-helix transcriptional regulator n=1 Tax=Chitinophaga sp. TaxID=1869181 RepID=UPI002B5E6329|nr:helix-turn-helix transcriptional regulator [Chitinophaga sp.]HWV67625.1 helix-turn-helix transcriptional regulator [Chitinophaga sp.]